MITPFCLRAEFGNTVFKTYLKWTHHEDGNLRSDTCFIIVPGEEHYIRPGNNWNDYLKRYFNNLSKDAEGNESRMMSVATKSCIVEFYINSLGDELPRETLPYFYDEKQVHVDSIMSIEVIDHYIIGGLDGISSLHIPQDFNDSIYKVHFDTLYNVVSPWRVSFANSYDGMLEYADYCSIYYYDDDNDYTDSLIQSLIKLEKALYSSTGTYMDAYKTAEYRGFTIDDPVEDVPMEVRHIWYLVRGYSEHLNWTLKELEKNSFAIVWHSGI